MPLWQPGLFLGLVLSRAAFRPPVWSILPHHYMKTVTGLFIKLLAYGFQDADAWSCSHIGDRTTIGDTVEGAFDRDQVLLTKTGQRIKREKHVSPGGNLGFLNDGIKFVFHWK